MHLALRKKNRIVRFLRWLGLKFYTVWVLTVFTVFMLLYLPGILVPFIFGMRAGAVSYKFLKLWSWTFSILNFIHYDVRGREHVDRKKAYIYACNHTSFLDLPGISIALPTQFRPLAKKELLKIPVFGWIARSACVIVDRSSNQSRKQSMNHLKEILGAGISILIFPEGTQNRTTELLQPFYDGAFRIAIDTQQPILPMISINAGTLMPPGKAFIQPGKIRIVIGTEITTAGLTAEDLPALRQRTYDVMLGMLKANGAVHS